MLKFDFVGPPLVRRKIYRALAALKSPRISKIFVTKIKVISANLVLQKPFSGCRAMEQSGCFVALRSITMITSIGNQVGTWVNQELSKEKYSLKLEFSPLPEQDFARPRTDKSRCCQTVAPQSTWFRSCISCIKSRITYTLFAKVSPFFFQPPAKIHVLAEDRRHDDFLHLLAKSPLNLCTTSYIFRQMHQGI